jgi:hypothetical protein
MWSSSHEQLPHNIPIMIMIPLEAHRAAWIFQLRQPSLNSRASWRFRLPSA